MLGVDAPGAQAMPALHDMMVIKKCHDALPAQVGDHLVWRVVDELVPVTRGMTSKGW